MQKRLYRSENNVMVSGVCAGIAEYLNVDPTIVRLLWVLATIWTFSLGLIAYIVCIFVIPVDDGTIDGQYQEKK